MNWLWYLWKTIQTLEKERFIVVEAFYVLKSSGDMWHNNVSNNLSDMGFHPCIADFYFWMQDCGNHYEYVVVIVYDLIVFNFETRIYN